MPDGVAPGIGGRMGVRDVDGHLLTPGEMGRMHRCLDAAGVPPGPLRDRVAFLARVHPGSTDRP